MAKSKSRPFEADAFFAWRTPLLPVDELVRWTDTPRPLTDDAALANERTRLRQWLLALVDRPEIKEALFLASPSLEESLAAWREAPTSERGIKVERSVIRYFSRMAVRPTPFGLFAGMSIGKPGATTQLTLGPRDTYRRHTRLDGDYLTAVTAAVVADRAMRGELLFRPTSSLYDAGGRKRYVERRLVGKVRSYHLVAVEPTDYLEATLKRAQDGTRLAPLAEVLIGDEITRADADEFVDSLVESQLLVPDLSPRVTGDEPVSDIIEQLAHNDATKTIAGTLDEVRADLATLDSEPVGATPERFRALAKRLEPLPTPVEIARLFQVDLVKPVAEATVGADLLEELARAVDVLVEVAPTSDPGGSLRPFMDAFTTRYEQSEVPLLQALDEESGIGLGNNRGSSTEDSPLLAGLGLGVRGGDDGPTLRARDTFLFGKILAAAKDGAPWSLSDDDCKALKSERPPSLPSSYAVFAGLGRDEHGPQLHIHSAGGPSAANLLGRFCHGDPRLTQLVRDHLRREEALEPDAIFAEIVHLPEGRVGNVLLRPVLREHEIAYLGRSGAPHAQQITANDLWVSVLGGKVVLRSRRLGRRVLPRLTTAHNFSSPLNLGLYRFLCALQHQDGSGVSWSWGTAGNVAEFLPRVTSGRTILSLAQWRLTKKQIQELAPLKNAALWARVQALRGELRWPRFIGLADGDNVLPIDLDNVLSVEMWKNLVKERAGANMSELFPYPTELAVSGPEGGFTCEIVVPFVRAKPALLPSATATATDIFARPPTASAAPTAIRRSLPPGSSVLYAKIYCGEASADVVLRDGIAPIVQELGAAGAFTDWFFLRYADPQPHLRVRFFNGAEPARLQSEVAPRLHALIADAHEMGLAYKLQLDTYEREIERYAGPVGMLLSERVFTADSAAALGIVEQLSGDAAAEARWRLTLRGMDQLLDDFGYDLTQKRALVGELRKSYAAEFRIKTPHEKAIGDRFRKERGAVEKILDRRNDLESDLQPGLALLDERSRTLAPVVAELHAAEKSGLLTESVKTLVASYLHMWAIRLLRAQSRAHEAVIHDFLERSYESQQARAKKRG